MCTAGMASLRLCGSSSCDVLSTGASSAGIVMPWSSRSTASESAIKSMRMTITAYGSGGARQQPSSTAIFVTHEKSEGMADPLGQNGFETTTNHFVFCIRLVLKFMGSTALQLCSSDTPKQSRTCSRRRKPGFPLARHQPYVQAANYGAMLMPVTGFKTSIPSGGNVSETCWVWP